MTKQEKIREELAKRRYYDGWSSIGGNIPSWEDRTEVEREYFREKIDDDFRYLHSQGVVIKVERELPDIINRQTGYFKTPVDMANDMFKAGYVAVEPLIKEKEEGC